MPAPGNLSFETIGGVAGMAEGWHVRGRFAAVEIMGFGPVATVGPVNEPNDFGGGAWSPTGITVTPNAGVDPDGNTTADQLAATATTGIHADEQPNEDLAAGACYGVACWFFKGTSNYATIAWGLGTANASAAIFNLTSGRVVSTSRSGSISKASATIVELGVTGWFLATLYVTASAAVVGIKPAVGLSNGTALSYLGAGETVFVWGAAVFDLPRESFEAFERAWSNDVFLETLTIPDSAEPSTFLTSFVDPVDFEAFESGWENFPFLSTIATSESATFDTVPQAVEDFEIEWGATPFYTTIPSPVAATFGTTSPEAFESFEADWLTSPWITTFMGTPANFDGDLPQAFENFEEVIRDKVFTVDPDHDVFTSALHGLTDGVTLYVVRPDGGSLPEGMNPTICYVVGDSLPNTFTLLPAAGGSLDVTSKGEGTQRLRGDPARYWGETGYNSTL